MATKKIPVIALDSGHGLNTPGKRTPDGIREWVLNDEVRDRCAEYLKDYECKIIYPDNNEGKVDESLTSRKAMYVNADVDAAVSFHHNAYSGKWNSKATGVETWVDRNCTAADMRLAKCIQKRLPEYTGLKDRGIKKEDFTVIYQNKCPSALCEGGFMDSRIDYPVITSDKGQDAYARAVAEGLVEFLDLKKKTTSSNSTSKKPSTSTATNNNTSLKFKVGDVVQFKGTKHYKNANAASGSDCKSGKAKITALSKGSKHPYHLQNVSGGGSTVYGWVDEKDVAKVSTSANTETNEYYKKYTGQSSQINVVFEKIGVPSKYIGKWAARKPVALANGLKNYKGSGSDNLALIALAKKGKLRKP